MADNKRSDESDDYGEREIKAGHIYEDEDDFEEEEVLDDADEPEQDYEDQPQDEEEDRGTLEGIQLGKMKELIMSFQLALKKKDYELLESKKQNIMLLEELEKISNQYLQDRSKEEDQLVRVKQYEEEFQKIQKGSIGLFRNAGKACFSGRCSCSSKKP